MKRTTLKRGASPPLFDRIVDPKLGMPTPPALLDAAQMRESIIRELTAVLNTRCTVRNVLYQKHFESIAFFGMPDFFGLQDLSAPEFDGSNSNQWPRAARAIQMAIQAAEPRLENVRVSVESYDPSRQQLSIIVRASLKHMSQTEEIHFPLALAHVPMISA